MTRASMSPRSALAIEQRRADRLRYLIGCVVQALEGYDSDDGNNQLVLAGIVAELSKIEGEYEAATA